MTESYLVCTVPRPLLYKPDSGPIKKGGPAICVDVAENEAFVVVFKCVQFNAISLDALAMYRAPTLNAGLYTLV